MHAFRPSGRVIGAAVITVALVAMIAIPAFADTTSKPYAADVSPHPLPAGSTRTLTLTLENETGTQQLGSANLTAPAGFSILGVTAAPTPTGTATIAGASIQLRNLALPAGGTAQVSFQVRVPCPDGVYTWSTIAKQSNNFSGPPGNNLFFDAANSDLTSTVSGVCHLGFDFLRGPADAQVNTNITSVRYTPTGLPVQVQVLDANGDLISSSTAPVTLAIGANPGGATNGPTTQNAVGGIATFSTLSLNRTGLDYTFVASTTTAAIDPGTSGVFDIVDVGKNCPAGPCSSGNVVHGNTTATEDASAGTAGDQLTLAVSVEPLDCSGYSEVSEVVTFDVTGSRTKTVTITMPKSVAGNANALRVCYSAPVPFEDRNGNLVTIGLLPDCSSAPAPCMVSAKNVKQTAVVIFNAPEGDPKGRV
jgi:hypothetical protein